MYLCKHKVIKAWYHLVILKKLNSHEFNSFCLDLIYLILKFFLYI